MTQEALIFYSPVDDPEAWRNALASELPDLEFRTDPAAGDPADVRFALVWLPPKGFFAPFTNLSLITNLGAGVDALLGRDDLRPVPVSRLSDPGMVGLMTSYVTFAVTRYARDMHVFERATRRGEWHYVHPRPLNEISVGVLGLGELGAACAGFLAGMGYDVRGWSRTPKSIEGVACSSGQEAFDEILKSVEIVVVMLPLTPATRHMIGKREFALMRPDAKLINASRGAVIQEAPLVEALRTKRLSEATLDVFEVEPLPAGHPLWSLDNVLITPHLASVTTPALAARDVAESIRRVRRGEPPLHQVNPQAGY